MRAYREQRGWSQMTMAEEAGLHLNAVGSLERGLCGPTVQTLFLISRALGIPPSRLIADVEQMKPEVE